MNVIKEYNTAKKKKGNVCFGSIRGGAWVFRCSDKESGSLEKIIRLHGGGLEVAERIALIISKSWLRTAGKKIEASSRLDRTARRTITTLVQLRTLKDWKGEPEWWSTAGPEGVKQVYINHQPDSRPVVEADLVVETAPVKSELVPAP